jgi:hypothetical protein
MLFHVRTLGVNHNASLAVISPADYFGEVEKHLYRHTSLGQTVGTLLGGSALDQDRIRHLLEHTWGVKEDWLAKRGTSKPLLSPWGSQPSNDLLTFFRARWSEGMWLFHALPSAAPAAQVERWHRCGRDWGTRAFSFAIPTHEAVQAIHALKCGVVELGAATGYWSSLMEQKGILVRALDIQPASASESHTRVHAGDTGSLAELDPEEFDALLLCFPPPGQDNMADEALRVFRGSHVVYVGEWATGMTGSMEFHRTLQTKFKLIQQVSLPRWAGTCYDMRIFRKRVSPIASSSPYALSSLWQCDVNGCAAGNAQNLRRCRVTRKVVVCSQECWAKCEDWYKGLAMLEHASPISFELFGPPCVDQASGDREWAELAKSTPNERGR